MTLGTWRWLTRPREPRWKDSIFLFGYIWLLWQIAFFIQKRWYGVSYSKLPYRVLFTGLAIIAPLILRLLLGGLLWIGQKLEGLDF